MMIVDQLTYHLVVTVEFHLPMLKFRLKYWNDSYKLQV